MSAALSIAAIGVGVLFGTLVLAMGLDVYTRRRELWKDDEDEDSTPPPVS